MEADAFIMKMYPTSLLPTEPAGRIATVMEWVNSGVIPPDEGMRLLDFPDIEGYRSLQDSAIDDHYYVLEQLLYKGKWITPEPYEDLKGAMPFMQKALLRARVDEAPENRMDLIRRWMSQAEALIKRAAQEEQVMAAKAQMEAAGGPMAAAPGPGPEAGMAGPGQAPMPEEVPGMPPGMPPEVPVI